MLTYGSLLTSMITTS